MSAGNFSFETIKRAIVLDQMGVKSLEISQKLKVPLPLLMKWLENSQALLEMAGDLEETEKHETQHEDISECSINPIVQESKVSENVKPKRQYNKKTLSKNEDVASEILPISEKPKRKYVRKAQTQPTTPVPTNEISETCELNKPKRKYVRKIKVPSTTSDPQSIMSIEPSEISKTSDIPMVKSDYPSNIMSNMEIPRVIDSKVCDIAETQKLQKPKRQYTRKPVSSAAKVADTNLPKIIKTSHPLDDISMTTLSSISSSSECDLPEKQQDTHISIDPIKTMTKNVDQLSVNRDLSLLNENYPKPISPVKLYDIPKRQEKSETIQKPIKEKISKVPEEGNKRYKAVGGYKKFGKSVDFGPKAGSIMPQNYIITPFEKKARPEPISYEEQLPVLTASKPTPVVQKKFKTGLLSHEEINRRRLIFEQILNEMNSTSEEESEPNISCNVVTQSLQEDLTEEIKSNENEIYGKENETNLEEYFEAGWYKDAVKELMQSSSEDESIKDQNDEGMNVTSENDTCILNAVDTDHDMLSQCSKDECPVDEMNSTSEEESEPNISCNVVTQSLQEDLTGEIKSNENEIYGKESETNLEEHFEAGWYKDAVKELMQSSSEDEPIKDQNDEGMNVTSENDTCILNAVDTDHDMLSQCSKDECPVDEIDMTQLQMDLYLSDSDEESDEESDSDSSSDTSVTTTDNESQKCLEQNPLTEGNPDDNDVDLDQYLSDINDGNSQTGEIPFPSDFSEDEDLVSINEKHCQLQDHSYIDQVADELKSAKMNFDDNW